MLQLSPRPEIITHRKYPTARAVKGYTVDRGKVAEDTFVYLHVLVGGRRHGLAESCCAYGLTGTHDGHLIKRHTRTITGS